jgi:hypothetical protein
MSTNAGDTTYSPTREQVDNLQAFELFAEELPELHDFSASTIACISTGACSCVFSTAGTLSTVRPD